MLFYTCYRFNQVSSLRVKYLFIFQKGSVLQLRSVDVAISDLKQGVL